MKVIKLTTEEQAIARECLAKIHFLEAEGSRIRREFSAARDEYNKLRHAIEKKYRPDSTSDGGEATISDGCEYAVLGW